MPISSGVGIFFLHASEQLLKGHKGPKGPKGHKGQQ